MELHLGTSKEAIQEASKILGIKFPEILEEIWLTSNGLELPNGYRFFPVFDPKNPKKSWGHIVYENTKGRWDYMSNDLVSIAGGDTGNCLVLKKNGKLLDPQIFVWDHETNKIKKKNYGLEYILDRAKKRVEQIEKKVKK